MSSILTLKSLLIDELKELYFAEKQLVKALPKMAEAAVNAELKAAFINHLEETRGHVERLTEALEILGELATGTACHAMIGLVEESTEAIDSYGPSSVRDANLIGAAQRVEHYEMAAYKSACAFARTLRTDRVGDLLQATLDEEGFANTRFTRIASVVNVDALRTEGGDNPVAY